MPFKKKKKLTIILKKWGQFFFFFWVRIPLTGDIIIMTNMQMGQSQPKKIENFMKQFLFLKYTLYAI